MIQYKLLPIEKGLSLPFGMYLATKYDKSPFEYELLHIFFLEELEYERLQGFRNKQECEDYTLPEEIKTSPVRFSCYKGMKVFLDDS